MTLPTLLALALGCYSSPPMLFRSTTTTEGQAPTAVWMGDVERDFVVDLVGEEALWECEQALEPGGDSCRVLVGGCMTLLISPDSVTSALIIEPSRCGDADITPRSFVDLGGDDALTVSSGEQTKELEKRSIGDYREYVATFEVDSPDTLFDVAFARAAHRERLLYVFHAAAGASR